MALGVSLSTVILTGAYVDFSGAPITGQIIVTMSSVLRNPTDNQMVAPSAIVVPLVNGTFSTVVPATNDPDIDPNPFIYSLEESFPGGRKYNISLPYTSTTLDLANISPLPTLSSISVSIVDITTWTPLAVNIDTLLANVLALGTITATVGNATISATTTATNATTVANLLTDTLNPLLLIGG